MYQRKQVAVISQRMREFDNPIMQVVTGPRQTGKSTMIAQALQTFEHPFHSISADDALVQSADWLATEWQQARNLTQGGARPALLVVDEIQKIKNWPTIVKGLWDADRRSNTPLKVVLSGSSSLLLRHGLEDALTGRFELIHSPHWSFSECADAFGFSLDEYLYFGAFPGAARYAGDAARWKKYVNESIIEPTISQDVLALEQVRKPALMRALFRLGAAFSAQELSYTKMLGQLQDAGNTTTLAHYLDLLGKVGMVAGLQKYNPKRLQQKKSSPRLMVYNTALMTAVSDKTQEQLLGVPDFRGHLVETAVGAHLMARADDEGFDVFWWREGNDEVDFVLSRGEALCAIEVKSGRTKGQGGMAAFLKQYPTAKRIVVGGFAAGACTLEDFLTDKVELWG